MDEDVFREFSAADAGDGTQLSTPPTAVFDTECGGSAVEAVVSLVAQEEDCDPLELPPLYRAVDPDALDALCRNYAGEKLDVTFSYCGYRVLVEGEGIVQLLDTEPDRYR